jgi:predicted nucleic acid-binding protein
VLAISDSSALILLSRIGRLELLQGTYGHILIPPAVSAEVIHDVHERAGSDEVRSAGWIRIVSPRSIECVEALRRSLGIGESEAIALAEEADEEAFVILDDRPARATARRLGLTVVGTAGVLLLAKQRGLIPAVGPVLDDLLQANMRLGPDEVSAVLKLAGELPPIPHS